MPINFHAEENRLSYANRKADQSWIDFVGRLVDIKGKKVLEIGCGGGIYCKAMAELGAASVTGVDFSAQMLSGARENCREFAQISFVQGSAEDTGLPGGQYDLLLERALIHHIRHFQPCFTEAFRLLRSGGRFLVQDRTPEDCLLPGSNTHIRGYIFEFFPKLAEKETARRHKDGDVRKNLEQAGFTNITTFQFWETRKTYQSMAELQNDLSARTGGSILHELTDDELKALIRYIQEKIERDDHEPVIEQDRWTVWLAEKPVA